MDDNEMPWLKEIDEKVEGLWQSLKGWIGTSPGVADYGWITPEAYADSPQESPEYGHDAFMEGAVATPGPEGYGSEQTPTPEVADYGWVTPEAYADSPQESEEPVRDAFTEGFIATPGLWEYGGNQAPGVFDYGLHAIKEGGKDILKDKLGLLEGTALVLSNDRATDRGVIPEYTMLPEYQQGQELGGREALRNISRGARWLREAEWLQPDTSLEAPTTEQGKLAYNTTRMVPQLIDMALASYGGPLGLLLAAGTQIAGNTYNRLTSMPSKEEADQKGWTREMLKERGIDYDELPDQKVSPERALEAGVINAALQAPLERLAYGKLLKVGNAAKPIHHVADSVASNATVEGMQQVIQDATEIWAKTPGKTWDERVDNFNRNIDNTFKEGTDSAKVAALFSLLVSGAGIAGSKMRRHTAQSDELPGQTEKSSANESGSEQKAKSGLSEDTVPKEANLPSNEDVLAAKDTEPKPQEERVTKRVIAEEQVELGDSSTAVSTIEKADTQSVPVADTVRNKVPLAANEDVQAAQGSEGKQREASREQRTEQLQEATEDSSAREQAAAGRSAVRKANTQELGTAEWGARRIVQQPEPLPASQQADMRRSLANAVQSGDYAAADKIASRLGMAERAKRYADLVQPNSGRRPLGDAFRRTANGDHTAAAEQYPVSLGVVERPRGVSAAYPVKQNQGDPGGQMRPGVRFRSGEYGGKQTAGGVQVAGLVTNGPARGLSPKLSEGYAARGMEGTGPKAMIREEGAKYSGQEALIANNPLYKGDKTALDVAERAIQDTLHFAKGVVATPPNRSRQYQEGVAASGAARQGIGAADGVQGRMKDRTTNRGERREGKTIGLGVTRELVRGEAVSLVGKKVKGSEELAVHAQVVRHPGYETLHIVYVKGNTVVHHEAYSSRLPDQVSFLSRGENLDTFGKHLDETGKRVGADGYYLVHNHPSGDPRPSREDVALTEYFGKQRAPQGTGLQGHVVINSSRYAVIDKEGRVSEHELTLTEGDKLLTPESKHAALGVRIKDADTLASIAKNEQLSDNQSVVYYLTAQNEVRGVQVVPNEILGNAKVAARYLRWGTRAHYAKIPAIVTSDKAVYEGMHNLAKKGFVLDVVPVEYGRGIAGKVAEGRGATVEYSRKSAGIEGSIKAERVVNGKGNSYPKVEVEGHGEVPFPDGPYKPNNSSALRPQFTDSYKKQFKEWWTGQGKSWPEGEVNIHHIKPLSKGGDNSFQNLVPLVQPEEHQPFTNWWRSYPLKK